MKILIRIIAFAFFASIFSGCGIYKVQTKTDKLEGIPFHTKKLVYKQKTVYAAPYYLVEITLKKKDDDEKNTNKLPAFEVLVNDKTENLLSAIAIQTNFNANSLALLMKMKFNLQEIDPEYIQRISNTFERKMVISDEVHYINGHRPLFGNAEINIELNEDNTLSTSTASIEDNTGENLLNLVPGTEILSKWFKLEKLEESVDSTQMKGNTFDKFGIEIESQENYELKLSAKKDYYLITFTKELENLEDIGNYIDFDLKKGFYTISKEKQSSKEDKKKSKGIEFQGSVSLPDQD